MFSEKSSATDHSLWQWIKQRRIIWLWLIFMAVIPFILVSQLTDNVQLQRIGHKTWFERMGAFQSDQGDDNLAVRCVYGSFLLAGKERTLKEYSLRFKPVTENNELIFSTDSEVTWRFQISANAPSYFQSFRELLFREHIYIQYAMIGEQSGLRLSPTKEKKSSTNSQNYDVTPYRVDDQPINIDYRWSLSEDLENNVLLVLLSFQPFSEQRLAELGRDFDEKFPKNTAINFNSVETFFNNRFNTSLTYYFKTSPNGNSCSELLAQYRDWCISVSKNAMQCDCYNQDYFNNHMSYCLASM